jgi:uncharacterized metal-binding protein
VKISHHESWGAVLMKRELMTGLSSSVEIYSILCTQLSSVEKEQISLSRLPMENFFLSCHYI